LWRAGGFVDNLGGMRPLFFFGCLAIGFSVGSCATYQDTLGRGQKAFEANDYDRALAMFRGLEPDLRHLSSEDQARYAYLRGMTDYRVGYKLESRHWLGMANAIESQTPGSLPSDWSKRMTDALKELNEDVYTGGAQALSNQKGRQADEQASADANSAGDGETKKKTKSEDEP
jgi:hypothetical protein